MNFKILRSLGFLHQYNHLQELSSFVTQQIRILGTEIGEEGERKKQKQKSHNGYRI